MGLKRIKGAPVPPAMVDWDRVRELRAAGTDWDTIAADPKVGYRPDANVTEPGPALRALYHREKARRARQGPAPAAPRKPATAQESKWTAIRAFYLVVPVLAIWFLLAYAAPSPIGLLVPSFPWLGLALAVAAVVLIYLLWRTSQRRWTTIYRTTVIGGVVLGLVFAGMVGLVGALVYGCPYLPPSGAVGASPATGWHGPSGLPTWTDGGRPVIYFFGATWCPYCSASSWAIWKALISFGTLSGTTLGYSSSTDVYPTTPEIVLANASLSSSSISLQVSEYAGGVDGTPPSTSNCYQLAYVTAYSGGSIPFLVVGGKYVHGGTTIIDPKTIQNFSKENAGPGGNTAVKNDVFNETGIPWTAIQYQAWWIMAFLAKCSGLSVSQLATMGSQHWSVATQNAVNADLQQL